MAVVVVVVGGGGVAAILSASYVRSEPLRNTTKIGSPNGLWLNPVGKVQ